MYWPILTGERKTWGFCCCCKTGRTR